MLYKEPNQDGFELSHLNDDELEKFINEVCEDLSPDNTGINKLNTRQYEFEINNLIYHVEITESIIKNTNEKMISIKFKLMNNPNAPKRKDFATDRQYQMAVQKSQIGISGTGNSQKVFRKVISAIIMGINELKPKYVTFNADETDRQRLYGKLINLIQKYTPFKYKQLKNHPTSNEELSSDEFWLEIEYQ